MPTRAEPTPAATRTRTMAVVVATAAAATKGATTTTRTKAVAAVVAEDMAVEEEGVADGELSEGEEGAGSNMVVIFVCILLRWKDMGTLALNLGDHRIAWVCYFLI